MRHIFNFGLYKEGLKQSKIVGAIFTSIMMIGAIFIPLMMILNQSDAAAYGEVEKYMVSGTGYNMILILSFCMFAPFLALTLFSFLNKRNRSDFYHSLPHRRETIFISYSLSILTWIIGAIVLSSAVTSLMYWIGSQYIAVNYTSVLVYLFNLICASILVYAATLLAMTITGTSFSNVVTALLIIFLPRLIMTVFANTIVSTVYIVPLEEFGIWGNCSYNIPFSFVTGIFGNNQLLLSAFSQIGSGIYSLVLGFIYFGIALLLFGRRQSEMAGSSAPNRWVQTTIRIAISFVVCTIPCVMIYNNFTGAYVDPIFIFLFYVIALLVYFVYELITTKSFKNLARSIPMLGILLVLNIAFVGGALGTREILLNTNIDPQQVQYATLQPVNQDYYDGTPQAKTYEYLNSESIQITDKEVHRILVDALSAAQKEVKENSYYQYNNVNPDTAYVDRTFVLTLQSGKQIKRTVRVKDTDDAALTALLAKNETFKQAYMELPADPAVVQIDGISSDQLANELYDSLRNEVKEMKFETWFSLLNNTYPIHDGEEVPTFFVNIKGSYGVDDYSSSYIISPQTPKTYEKYFQLVNQSNLEGFNQQLERVVSLTEADRAYGYLLVQGYCFKDQNGTPLYCSEGYSYPVYWDGTGSNPALDTEVLETIKTSVSKQGTKPVDWNKPFYCVTLEYSYEIDQSYQSKTMVFFFQSDQDQPIIESVEAY